MGTKTGVAIAVGVAVAGSFLGGTIMGNRGDRTERIEADSEVTELRARLEVLETTRSGPAELRSPAGEDRRVAELEARLATQSARLDAIESSVKTDLHDPVPRSAAGPRAADAAPPVRDVAAEPQHRRGLTDDALLAELREMMTVPTRGGKTDGKAVLDVCEVLLSRTLDPAKRAAALIYKGIGHRILLDRTSEEAAFRDAVATAVPGSKDAIEAAYQLAWTVASGGDHRGAAELFLGIASNPGATPLQRASNRLSAAKQFEAAGDKERAVAEYRGVVADFGNSDDRVVRRFAEDARLALERLAK